MRKRLPTKLKWISSPSSVRSYGGNRNTLVIVDDYSSRLGRRHSGDVKRLSTARHPEGLRRHSPTPHGAAVIRGEVVVHARWWQRLGDGDDGGSADGRSREVVVLGGLWHGCLCGGASVVRVKVVERQCRPRRKIFSGGRKNHGGTGNFEGGTKWVFRNKLDENGIVSRNKARLVAQAYNQQEDIDYDETYSPVARLESIRILLAYACALDFKLFQMDVKSAFLNSFINEEVYVAQPPGFIDFEKPDHVYKLKKALYGLNQAPKACVCLCGRFQEAPKTSHLEAVKRIFRYIKGTTHLGLWYPKGTIIETVVYADSDHAGDYVDRKSTNGICTFVGFCLTSWFSKKQTALAISTTEVEYVSSRKACQQALWMKQALIDYDVRLDDVLNPLKKNRLTIYVLV
ncbi:copia protein [Tanacetum coccineum]